MKLRGRVDVAKEVCDSLGIHTYTPLATVVGSEKLYCEYKLLLYEREITSLLSIYTATKDKDIESDILYYIDSSRTLCDFSIDRGVDVTNIYDLIKGYYSLL